MAFADLLFSELESACHIIHPKTKAQYDSQNGCVRALLPMDEEGEIFVLTEINLFQPTEDLYYAQFYTTLETDITHKDEFERALQELNCYCPLGALGIFQSDAPQLYHKYTLVLEADEPDEISINRAAVILGAIYGYIRSIFYVAAGIARGAISYQDALDNSLLQPFEN